MKKIFLIFMMMALLLTGCSKNETMTDEDHTKKEIRIAALKGPTAMGLVKLFKDADENNSYDNYKYTILNSPEEVVAGLSKGDFDIAAIPSNLAAVLYNKSEGKLLRVVAINTGSVLYIASRDDSIKSLEDLKGKTIVASGKGATPEFALRFVLSKNGINPDSDVKLDFKSEHTEVVQDLVKNHDHIALLPQPFLTVAKSKVEGLKERISLGDEWRKIDGAGELITGVTVATNNFLLNDSPSLKSGKTGFDKFMEHYKKSVDFSNYKKEEAAKLIGEYKIFPEEVALKAIADCNLTFETKAKMKEDLSKFYEALFSMNPKSIGGKLPDEKFYFNK